MYISESSIERVITYRLCSGSTAVADNDTFSSILNTLKRHAFPPAFAFFFSSFFFFLLALFVSHLYSTNDQTGPRQPFHACGE